MILILMRHGEAEPEKDDLLNHERKLTKKGKVQARRTARILSKFLKDERIRIFTSPFARTKQTARVVAEECFAEELHVADELLQNDWNITAAHTVQDGAPMLFVSHHPFLQEYLATITGVFIPFRTSDMAVIDYDTEERTGRLIGYFSPTLRKLRKEEL